MSSGESESRIVLPTDFDMRPPSRPVSRAKGVSRARAPGTPGARRAVQMVNRRAISRVISTCGTWSSPTGTLSRGRAGCRPPAGRRSRGGRRRSSPPRCRVAYLVLERRVALERGLGNQHGEQQVELGVLLDVRLHEQGALGGINAGGEPVEHHLVRVDWISATWSAPVVSACQSATMWKFFIVILQLHPVSGARPTQLPRCKRPVGRMPERMRPSPRAQRLEAERRRRRGLRAQRIHP